MSRYPNNILKTPLYGNCRVENPEGTHIFNCGDKKARWYLSRSLAEIVKSDPLTIRLKFTPNGKGHAADDFYLQKRQNICVCCGRDDQLTKHHVVPFMYRSHFPDHLKDHNSYDILPLCYECHEKYEIYAHQFKKVLAKEHAVEKEIKVFDPELKKVCSAASALCSVSEIPEERYEYLIDIVRKHYAKLGQFSVTLADVEKASQIKYKTNREDYKPEGQAVVENLDSIEVFVKRWRQHFVSTLKPQHMPQYWDVDRPL